MEKVFHESNGLGVRGLGLCDIRNRRRGKASWTAQMAVIVSVAARQWGSSSLVAGLRRRTRPVTRGVLCVLRNAPRKVVAVAEV